MLEGSIENCLSGNEKNEIWLSQKHCLRQNHKKSTSSIQLVEFKVLLVDFMQARKMSKARKKKSTSRI